MTASFGATSSVLICEVDVSLEITAFFEFITEALRKGSACAGKSANSLKNNEPFGIVFVVKGQADANDFSGNF